MSHSDGSSGVILVVDDQATQRLLATEALRQGGFDVIEATSGEAALELFPRHDVAAIVLDVMMPGMDGFEVCGQIRALPGGRHAPVMMMTARDDEAAITRAYDVGATDFVSKPVNPLVLTNRMRYMLRSAATAAELRSNQEKIRALAYFDDLTGLPNRTFFTEHLRYLMAAAARSGQRIAVLHIDMDEFKRINEFAGRVAGDEILKQIGERIAGGLRSSDVVMRDSAATPVEPGAQTASPLARLGGDEFMVLLGDLSANDDVAVVAQRILSSLEEPFIVDTQRFQLSASIGAASFPTDSNDAETLLRHADSALTEAKRLGKSRFQPYADEIHDRLVERIFINNELRGAVQRGELQVFYQPKINVHVDQVSGMEALVRWTMPDGRVVSPGEFIPIAEESDLINPLGHFVLSQACADAQRWSTSGMPNLEVSVNLSFRQLERDSLVSEISAVLDATGFDPTQLCLEVTESGLMRRHDQSARILSGLKDLGCKIAIDDFGTGYSSLSYLKRFPIDTLKIDRSFVMDLGTPDGDPTVVTAIVRLAQTLGLTIVAEGVETEEQARIIRALGCDEIQGFLYGRPQPAEQLDDWLHSRLAVSTVLNASAGADSAQDRTS